MKQRIRIWSACALFMGARAMATQYELVKDAPPVYGSDLSVKAAYEDTLLDIARHGLRATGNLGSEHCRLEIHWLNFFLPMILKQ